MIRSRVPRADVELSIADSAGQIDVLINNAAVAKFRDAETAERLREISAGPVGFDLPRPTK